MTDEHEGMGMSDPTPPPGMPTEQHDDRGVLEGAGDFTSGEGLVALAGWVLIGIWVIFDVFLDDYGIATLTLLFAALVVMAPRMPDKVAKVHPVPVVMKVAGYALALIGVVAVVEAVEEGFFEEAATIIAALLEYAAFAAAFIGARQIKT